MMQRSGKYDQSLLSDMLLDVENTLSGDDVGLWHKTLYPLNKDTDPYEVTSMAIKLPPMGLITLDRMIVELQSKDKDLANEKAHAIKKEVYNNFLLSHDLMKICSYYDDGCIYYWDRKLHLMYVYTMDGDVEVMDPNSDVYKELTTIINGQLAT
jgi:hypothetical protein